MGWRPEGNRVGARTFAFGAIGLRWRGLVWVVALLGMVFGDVGLFVERVWPTKGPIAENQSADDLKGKHQQGALGVGGKSFCLPTFQAT